MSYRKIALSVGFFIIVTSLLLLLSLAYVIKKKGLFEPQVHYKLIAKDAENITEGMSILFSGFEIGQVERLALYENGEVLVSISIPEHNAKWVRSDAVFTLEKPLIGNAKITLHSSMKNAPLDEKTILRMQIKDGINEIISNIQPVVTELQNIVSNVNVLSSTLSDKNGSFQMSLNHLERFSNRLSISPDLLQTITGNPQSARKLHESILSLELLLEEMRSLTQNTDQSVTEIRTDIIKPANLNMQELELILKDTRSKLQEIDETVRIIGQSDKDIAYFKDEMKVWLEEVTELSTRINTMIGKERLENIELP